MSTSKVVDNFMPWKILRKKRCMNLNVNIIKHISRASPFQRGVYQIHNATLSTYLFSRMNKKFKLIRAMVGIFKKVISHSYGNKL